MTKEKKSKGYRRITWTVRSMPKRLKDQFVGLCKMKGASVSEVLEYIIGKWIRDEKGKEGMDR